ncbi:MAG: zf-HC2 domain-containing protein [Ilumatobacteraceae bacterium]
MAECDDTLRELDVFLDGVLTARAHTTIRAHLDGCPDCLQAFDFQAELKLMIAERCRRDELPPGLVERIERCFDTRLE